MTISSALMCLYSRHVPRRRGGCCDLPGGQGSLNDNSQELVTSGHKPHTHINKLFFIILYLGNI